MGKLPKRKLLIQLPLGLLAVVLLMGAYQGVQQLRGNFHAPLPGEMYRSAQLHPGDITRYQQEYHIASVLNLRGENLKQQWYRDEVAEAERTGVTHINFRMSASKELTAEEAHQLIAIMRAAPKPMLIHCQAGADRTGLAAALYMAAIAKKGEWAAEKQMWLPYGHLPLWINGAYAMNRTFERLEPALGFPNS